MGKDRYFQKRAFILVGSIIIVYFLLATPMYIRGALVWSDNFNDGNYDGWTISEGSFSVSGGILQITGTEAGWIYRESTVNVGTWSWDMLDNDQHTPVTFFGTDEDLNTVVWVSGYQMSLNPDNSVIFARLTGENYIVLTSHTPSEELSGWQHIDVTRSTDSVFRLYLNGTMVIEIQDTTFDIPYTFQFGGYPGAAIDNITVSNTIDVQTTLPTPPIPGFPWITIPLAIGLSLTMVIIIRYRDRKTRISTSKSKC